MGIIMATRPYAHLQLDSWNCWERGDPENAVIIYGDEVKAKARPRFRSEEVSDVTTSTQKINPADPTEKKT